MPKQRTLVMISIITMIVGGIIIAHGRTVILGLLMTLAGFLIAWLWDFWPEIKKSFFNNKKGH